MGKPLPLAATVAAALLLGCGSGEREEIAPEDTVVGDLVTAPERAGDRANAAVDAHREALERQLEESEGAPAE